MIDKKELEIIKNMLEESSTIAEDMECTYNNSYYNLKEIYEDGWSDEGKYSTNFMVYALQKDKEDTGVRFGQTVSRFGSYHSSYEWEYESIALVEEREMTIKGWFFCN